MTVDEDATRDHAAGRHPGPFTQHGCPVCELERTVPAVRTVCSIGIGRLEIVSRRRTAISSRPR